MFNSFGGVGVIMISVPGFLKPKHLTQHIILVLLARLQASHVGAATEHGQCPMAALQPFMPSAPQGCSASLLANNFHHFSSCIHDFIMTLVLMHRGCMSARSSGGFPHPALHLCFSTRLASRQNLHSQGVHGDRPRTHNMCTPNLVAYA